MGFKEKIFKLTFQKTEEEIKPVEHLGADDETVFFHEVEKSKSWTDFALETQDGDSDQRGGCFYPNYEQNVLYSRLQVGDLSKVKVAVLDVAHHLRIGPMVYGDEGCQVSQRDNKTDEHPLHQAKNILCHIEQATLGRFVNLEQAICIEQKVHRKEDPGSDNIGEASDSDGKEEGVEDVEEGGDHHAGVDVLLATRNSPE